MRAMYTLQFGRSTSIVALGKVKFLQQEISSFQYMLMSPSVPAFSQGLGAAVQDVIDRCCSVDHCTKDRMCRRLAPTCQRNGGE